MASEEVSHHRAEHSLGVVTEPGGVKYAALDLCRSSQDLLVIDEAYANGERCRQRGGIDIGYRFDWPRRERHEGVVEEVAEDLCPVLVLLISPPEAHEVGAAVHGQDRAVDERVVVLQRLAPIGCFLPVGVAPQKCDADEPEQ